MCWDWREVVFIPRSLSAADRRWHLAAFWAKEHPVGAEQPEHPSQGRKGPSSAWPKLRDAKSEGNVCWLQFPPSTRQWFAWGHPQVRPAWCRLPPFPHEWPRALSPHVSPCLPMPPHVSPCLFGNCVPHLCFFPTSETAGSLDTLTALYLPPAQKITWTSHCHLSILLL